MSTRLLYDSDADTLDNGVKRRAFTVTTSRVVKLTASGLAPAECVPIFVRAGASSNITAGDCVGCPPSETNDYSWSPLFQCGIAVQLCGTNNQFIMSVPGNYMLGDPAVTPVFAGDVNIASEELGAEFRTLPGECPVDDNGGGPAAVVIQSSCAEPVFVELCETPTFMVETALAELGCVVDAQGVLTGKVILIRTVDEDTGIVTVIKRLENVNGTSVEPYTGPWGPCPEHVPDTTKQMWSTTVAFAANDVTPQDVNPPNLMQAATTYNLSNEWLRGVVTYEPGITFNGPPTEHCFMVPPRGEYSFDLSSNDLSYGGRAMAPIEAIRYNLVDLGSTSQGSNGLTEISTPLPVFAVVNFTTR